VAVNEKQRHGDRDGRCNEAKGFNRKPAPVEQVEVAGPYGDGRHNHDEEGAIHGEGCESLGRHYGQYVADVVSVSQIVTRAIRAPAGMPFICRNV
jgi:hypothetical protein